MGARLTGSGPDRVLPMEAGSHSDEDDSLASDEQCDERVPDKVSAPPDPTREGVHVMGQGAMEVDSPHSDDGEDDGSSRMQGGKRRRIIESDGDESAPDKDESGAADDDDGDFDEKPTDAGDSAHSESEDSEHDDPEKEKSDEYKEDSESNEVEESLLHDAPLGLCGVTSA